MEKLFSTPHHHRRLMVAGVLVLLLVGLFVTFVHRADAASLTQSSDSHIITLHDDGNDIGFITKKTTVREALQDAHIRLDANDRTEPSLDSKLVASSYQINIYRARPVVIRDGQTETKLITSYRTAKQIAAQAKISLRDEDVTTLTASDDPIADGAAEVMTITRAVPFTLVFYGQTEQSYTQAHTVGDMLKEKHITLQASDGVAPASTTALTSGMTIKIWRDGVQTVTQNEPVAFSVKQVQDADQPIGYKKVETPGQNGERTVTYEGNVLHGVEVSRKEINSVVITDATEQIEIIGAKVSLPAGSHTDWMAAAGISEEDYGYVDYIVGRESGWSPTKYNYAGSGAYGLCQALPGSKMATTGSDYLTNPITQLKWCSGYAVGRYGSWSGAYAFWIKYHWW